MKFDFIIGNPPYQEETAQKDDAINGQAPRKNIFQHFQMQCDKIANDSVVLIYPAGRWIHRAGKGLNEFGLKQINDPHLKKIIFYADTKDVFPNASIADGISIVVKDNRKTEPGFEYVYVQNGKETSIKMDNPGEELMPLDPSDALILEKIDNFVKKYKIGYMHDQIFPRTLFGIESDFVSKNKEIVRPLESNSSFDKKTEVKLYTNDKPGPSGRGMWFVVPKKVITKNTDLISEWQVVVSSAHPGGQENRSNQLEIIDNYSAFGRTRVALRSFKTKQEAQNFYNYVRSHVIRYTFLMTDEALASLGKRVPDVLNYSKTNEIIDFSKNIDEQLYKILNLTEKEIEFIESHIKEMN